MGNYTILYMFENPRRSRQARNFTTNAPKIPDLKSSSEQIFARKLPLGAPVLLLSMVSNSEHRDAGPKLLQYLTNVSTTSFACRSVLRKSCKFLRS